MLTAAAVRELRLLTRVWAALTKGAVLSLGADPSSRDGDASDVVVLPADVLAVALSVLGHRVALRRPEDEKSVFWGSEVRALRARRDVGEGAGAGKSRRTVEGVVREVVAVV